MKPPAAGNGRPKGALNKTTVAMKEAILSVYTDLQASEGGGNAHFLKWAGENPTDFYRLTSKLVPQDVRGSHEISVSSSVLEYAEAAKREVDEMFANDAILVAQKYGS